MTNATLSANWYFTPHVGFGFLQSTKEELQIPLGDEGISGRQGAHVSSKLGFLAGVAVGYQFNCFNVELDYTYTNNDLYKIKTDLDTTRNQRYFLYEGYMKADMLHVNGLYTFGRCCQLAPYVGGGVGAARLRVEQILGVAFFDGTTVDDSDIRFAFDLRAGLNYCFTECISVDLYYAYYNILRPRLHDVFNNRFSLNYHLHSGNFGLRYHF